MFQRGDTVAMQARSEPAERLLVAVETAHGSGVFHVDERLRAEEIRQCSDQDISTASIAVRLDDDFDGEQCRRRYQSNLRLAVMTDESDWTQRRMLFDGYIPRQTCKWQGRIDGEQESYIFEAESVYARLNRDASAMVYGRWMRNGEIEDGLLSDAATWQGRGALITALLCTFNPDGVGNMAELPLTVEGADGVSRSIHLFVADDAGGWKWTYATALRYLVWFYLRRCPVVGEGNVLAATDALVNGVSEGNALHRALSRECQSLSCEAMSLAEALAILCEAAGVHITADVAHVAGVPRTQLRVWAEEDGTLCTVNLSRAGRFADGTPRENSADRVSQLLSRNNTHRGQASWNAGKVINQAMVLGEGRQYELTVPLVPGWLPRGQLDNVAVGNRSSAKALALTPAMVETLGASAEDNAWYRQYHRSGSEFAANSDIARLWVLNEDGACSPTLFNRNGPFDAYEPFDFSTVLNANVTDRGAWVRRRRPLQSTISSSTSGRSLGVWVEVSFDGGTSWQQQSSSGIRVLSDRAGIYFDCDNPTEIAPTGVDPGEQNMWYAIIDQLFRVRVTAVIESDDRLIGTHLVSATSVGIAVAGFQLERNTRAYRYVTRTDGENTLADSCEAPNERNDTAFVMQDAKTLALSQPTPATTATPAIPWLETTYAIGDRLFEVRGRHLRLATGDGAVDQCPAIRERRFTWVDGRYETVLVLE